MRFGEQRSTIVLTGTVILCVAGCYASSGDSEDSENGGVDGSSCGLVDCGSSRDNNCNGTPDNADPDCVCDPAVDGDQPCNEHPGYDGVGACTAGYRECLGGHWSACRGDVGPSLEACSPDAPDTNCTGIQGDGAGCLTLLKIFAQLPTAECNAENGAVDNEDYHTLGQMVAGGTSPGSEWVEFTSFYVFSSPSDGLLPVHNCRAMYGWNDWYQYVQVGDSCMNLSNYMGWEDLGVVGYVAPPAPPGYRQLEQISLRYSYYGSDGFVDLAHVPVSSCPAKCACTPADAYVVP